MTLNGDECDESRMGDYVGWCKSGYARELMRYKHSSLRVILKAIISTKTGSYQVRNMVIGNINGTYDYAKL